MQIRERVIILGYDPSTDPRNHLVYEYIRMVKLIRIGVGLSIDWPKVQNSILYFNNLVG